MRVRRRNQKRAIGGGLICTLPALPHHTVAASFIFYISLACYRASKAIERGPLCRRQNEKGYRSSQSRRCRSGKEMQHNSRLHNEEHQCAAMDLIPWGQALEAREQLVFVLCTGLWKNLSRPCGRTEFVGLAHYHDSISKLDPTPSWSRSTPITRTFIDVNMS